MRHEANHEVREEARWMKSEVTEKEQEQEQERNLQFQRFVTKGIML
jgi:hypothetical protein